MDFQVFLSKPALNDLEQIVSFIATRNARAAERVGNELLDAAFSLVALPERGRAVPEFRRADLREIIVRSYRIIYRLTPGRPVVQIVRIWHAARGFPHVPREREN